MKKKTQKHTKTQKQEEEELINGGNYSPALI